jgi:hypothetical protein
MSDLKAITYRPGAGEYAWTFGGAAPVMRLRTPCALELYTEDCFAGRVQSADDLVSRLNITGLNPQTGPFCGDRTFTPLRQAASRPSRRLRRAWPRAGAEGCRSQSAF